jgi:hypothetical protein
LRNLAVIKPPSIDKEKKNGARKRPPKMEDTLSGLNQNQVDQYRPMPRPSRATFASLVVREKEPLQLLNRGPSM